MMRVYSKDFFVLKQALYDPDHEYLTAVDKASFHTHKNSLLVATLLSFSELATPKPDQAFVDKFTSGQASWPDINDSPYFYSQDETVDLKILKDIGLVSFFNNWINIHFKAPRSIETLDLDTDCTAFLGLVDLLKQLRSGGNTLMRPYHVIRGETYYQQTLDALSDIYPKGIAVKELQKIKGITVTQDGIEIRSEHLSLEVDDSLLATYLWQQLIEQCDSQSAFKRWVDYLSAFKCYLPRLNRHLLPHDAYQQFDEAFIDHLLQDSEFSTSWNCLQTRWVLESRADQLIYGYFRSKSQSNIDLAKTPTEMPRSMPAFLKYIADLYHQPDNRLSRHLWFQYNGNWPASDASPYQGLLSQYIRQRVGVSHYDLHANPKLSELLSASDKNPLLNLSLLYIQSYTFNNIDYCLYLLANPDTTAFGTQAALEKLFQHSRTKQTNTFLNTSTSEAHKLVVKTVLDNACKANSQSLEEIAAWIIDCAIQYTKVNTDDSDPLSTNSSTIHFIIELWPHTQALPIFPVIFNQISASQHRINNSDGSLYLLMHCLEYFHTYHSDSRHCDQIEQLVVELVSDTFENAWHSSGNDWFKLNNKIIHLPWQFLSESAQKALIKNLPEIRILTPYITGDVSGEISFNERNNKKQSVQYLLQILIAIALHDCTSVNHSKLVNKLILMAHMCGFEPENLDREKIVLAMFSDPIAYPFSKLDLWTLFCRLSNILTDQQYSDFIDAINNQARTQHWLTLYQQTHRDDRKDKIIDYAHNSISNSTLTSDSLENLEQSFYTCVNSANFTLTTQLITAAKQNLTHAKERIGNTGYFKEWEIKWQIHEYEAQLMAIIHASSLTVEEKKQKVIAQQLPKLNWQVHQENEAKKKCENFRQLMVAVICIPNNSEQSVASLEDLIEKATKSAQPVTQYFDNWLAAKLTLLEKNAASPNEYQGLVEQYKNHFQPFLYKHLSLIGAQNIMHGLLQAQNYTELERCWISLPEAYWHTFALASIYCKKLKLTGEENKAYDLLEKLKTFHGKDIDTLPGDIQDQFRELQEIITQDIEPKRLAIGTAHVLTQIDTNAALRVKLNEIKARNAEDISQIIANQHLAEFLTDRVIEISNELLMRNTFFHKPDGTGLIDEDRINDWFVSLFDHKLSHWGFGFRDQKRAGTSGNMTTYNAGEIDGFITDSANNRIAIFEAFKLAGQTARVVDSHLNKIAGYNPEGTNPVFILGYCVTKHFPALCDWYENHICKKSYRGFHQSQANNLANTLYSTGKLCLLQEIRMFQGQLITFNHLLLDLSLYS